MFELLVFILLMLAYAVLYRRAAILQEPDAQALAIDCASTPRAAPAKGVGLQRTDELSECDWAGQGGLPA
jgi:hypothetical protein